jgi:hypothetical protein
MNRDMNFLVQNKMSPRTMERKRIRMTMNALVELSPKEIVDELTWGLILVARRLILEYEICACSSSIISPVHVFG